MSNIIGAVVEVDGSKFTYCLGCFEEEDNPDKIGDINDTGVYGDKMPYPECYNCGEVIRPTEEEE